MEQFKVLWTGGWDSTFRIVELSRKEVEIQPVYVLDPNRKSCEYEKKAMKDILNALKRKTETKAKILDIMQIKLGDIPEDKEITEAYEKINECTSLGYQHEWLARLSKNIPNMEMCTENAEPENSRMIKSIKLFAKMNFIEDGVGIIDKANSSKEGNLVLGGFRYPIIKKTENDMLNIIREWHYEDIMKLIWFCHSPINGKPCGICHPCNVKMESHMEFLLSKEAIRRYKKQIMIRKILGEKAERVYIGVKRRLMTYLNKEDMK